MKAQPSQRSATRSEKFFMSARTPTIGIWAAILSAVFAASNRTYATALTLCSAAYRHRACTRVECES